MGLCVYCNKPVGFFRNAHRECEEKHRVTVEYMEALIHRSMTEGGTDESFQRLKDDLKALAPAGFVQPSEVERLLVSGFEKAVGHFLNDGNLEPEEQKRLETFARFFNLSPEVLNKNGAWTLMQKGIVLRTVLEGKIPEVVVEGATLPFNFQRGEKLVWVFTNVKYYEDRNVRRYVGGSSGVSFRIARGVYFRTGGFTATPVESVERIHVDTGMLAVTTKHLYFHGHRKSFRIPYGKIVSFTPYSDGVGVHRDAASAKPQTFRTGDGWFAYNLIFNVSKMHVREQS